VSDIASGRRVEAVFEVSGNPRAFDAASRLVGKLGRLILVAVYEEKRVEFNRDFLFEFPIPARSVARTAFLCKALADFVPRCSQVVAEVAGFAAGGLPTAEDAVFPVDSGDTAPCILGASSSKFVPVCASAYLAGDGSAAIFRSMLANNRRVRCPSASSNQ
jgi:hypothetical protein